MHFASSQNVNALNIGWNNKIDVRYQTTVTNIIVPAPEPSECQRAREERKIEALTEATRALERRERNEFLLDQKRRKEQETAEIPQTEQAQPTRNLNIQGSDAGYYSNGNYSQPIYIDQDRRDYNAGISAAINAGVEFNVGFGNNGACYPAVVHFVPVQRGCGRPIVRWHN
jgi:flagellar biosynthesis GTPase FlhF